MKKCVLMIWLMMCLMVQSCEKITEIYQTIDPSKQLQSSPSQDAKAKTLYRALQSYDSNKVKPLLNASLRQEIEQAPVAMIDLFKLIPDGQATFGKLDQAQQSFSAGVGDMTTQVYTFEYVDLTVALTIVFKGHAGGDEILAFTLDQIQNDQQPHQVGVTPTIQADAIAMELPKTGLEDDVTSSQSVTSSTAIEGLLAQSRAITADLKSDQSLTSTQEDSKGRSAKQDEQVEPLTLTQADRSTQAKVQSGVVKQSEVQQKSDSDRQKPQNTDQSVERRNAGSAELKHQTDRGKLQDQSQQKQSLETKSQDVNQDINQIMTGVAEAKAMAKQSLHTDDKATPKKDTNQSQLNKEEAKDVRNPGKSSELVEPKQGNALQQDREQASKDQSQELSLKGIESELSELKK